MTNIFRGRLPLIRLGVWGFGFLYLMSIVVWSQVPDVAESKVGFVSGLEILYGTQTGQKQIAEVQVFMEEKQKEYDVRRLELEQLRERFETQQLTLNAQTRSNMQRDIEEDDRELKRFQEDTQVEITRRRDEIFAGENVKLQSVLNEYAEENGFSVIFIRNETQIYVDPSIDVTQDIILVYDERYPVVSATTTDPSVP